MQFASAVTEVGGHYMVGLASGETKYFPGIHGDSDDDESIDLDDDEDCARDSESARDWSGRLPRKIGVRRVRLRFTDCLLETDFGCEFQRRVRCLHWNSNGFARGIVSLATNQYESELRTSPRADPSRGRSRWRR